MLIIYFYSILIISLLDLTDIPYKRQLFFLLILMGIVISGFRNMGGNDFIEYRDMYQHPVDKIEIGYTWLNMFFNRLGISFHAFTFICSCFCLTLLGLGIKEYSPYVLLSLCLYVGSYFLYYNMIAMRQVLSLSIILYSIKYIQRNENYKFIVSIVFASLFHTSALVFLPAYFFFKYFKLTVLYIIIFLAVGLTISIFIGSEIIMGFLLGHSSVIVEKMFTYLSESDFAISRIIKIVAILILILLFLNKLKDDFYFLFFSKMFVLYIFLYSIFYQFGILMRIWSYFDISTVFIIPILIKQIHNNFIRSIIFILFLVSAIISFQSIYTFDKGAMLKCTLFFLK